MTPPLDLWQHDVGYSPHKVTILEMVSRGRVLYLRWRVSSARGRNWRYASLNRSLLDSDGTPLKGRARKAMQQWAIDQAIAKYNALAQGQSPIVVEQAPLTIREAWAHVSDRATGAYPVDGPYHREVRAALEAAVRILGGDTPWASVRLADITRLGRTRIDELRTKEEHKAALLRKAGKPIPTPKGFRGAEITVARFLTVAEWLRGRELIPMDAAIAHKRWKDDLRVYWAQSRGIVGEPTPHRPRYPHEEMLALLSVAGDVDPRLDLLLALGAELRLGQVRRQWRSDLNITTTPGAFTVTSNRHKRGTVVLLTPGQRAAVDRALSGYLRLLEERYQTQGIDYPLFPSRKLVQHRYDDGLTAEPHDQMTPIHVTAMGKWWQLAEAKAGITHQRGRGWYGVRRSAVDAFLQLGGSKAALKEHGGWSSTAMPDQVYADQESAHFREEARTVRAKIRGEST